MRKIRVIATVLAMTMVMGSSMSVFATTYREAQKEAFAMEEVSFNMKKYDSDEEKTQAQNNELPAGDYYDGSLVSDFNDSNDAFTSETVNFIGNTDYDTDNWNVDLTELHEAAWTNLKNKYSALLATKITSDGSNYSAGGSSSSSNSSDSSDEGNSEETNLSDSFEENIKREEAQINAVYNDIEKDITASIANVNNLLASGNVAEANAAKSKGVTIDTVNIGWYSLAFDSYDNIERATQAGIPVTIKFRYAGTVFQVTIPAGAEVSELCFSDPIVRYVATGNGQQAQWVTIYNSTDFRNLDNQHYAITGSHLEKPYCGFLNLAAHYGFTVLQ